MPAKTRKCAKKDASSTKSAKQLTSSTADSELKQEETPPLDASVVSSSDKENDEIAIIPNQKEEADSGASGSESEEEESSSSDDDDDEMFAGLTKEEIAKVKASINATQQGFGAHMEREKTREIKQTKQQIEFNLQIQVSDEEAQFIAEFVAENHENLEEQLQNEGTLFLQSMQEMMEQKKQMMEQMDNNENNNNSDTDAAEDDDDDDDEDWVMAEKQRKAQRAANRKSRKVGKNLDGSTRCGRLLLNDALKNTASMEGWSEARKKAWKNRRTSPNAYFYRFNVPGQAQRNGKWTLSEHQLFMKRVRDIGVNDKWGLFSKAIPGRVGYQCSNYWRGLVKDGDVTDPNYHYDGKKLHFKRHTKEFAISSEYRKYAITINKDRSKIWTNLPQRHPKHPSDEYCAKVRDALKAHDNNNKTNKKKRKKAEDDGDEDWNAKPTKKKRRRRNNWNGNDDDEAFHCKVSTSDAYDSTVDDNPMPEFIDIMTGVGVIKPAISPYGHVLGYDTWTKILRTAKHKNMCPFTLQKLTRRSLVKLVKSNYAEHKDKIKNITKEQTDLLASINN